VMDAVERAVPLPQAEIIMDRAPRRQVFGQRPPLAAGAQDGRGRDGPFDPPPARIPACGFPAPGSCLGYGGGRKPGRRPGPCRSACSREEVSQLSQLGVWRVTARSALPLARRLSSIRSAAGDQPCLVRGLPRYYAPVRLLMTVHHRRRLLAFPMRTLRGFLPIGRS